MGIWGVELYQNDISLDVKEEFEELYNKGKNVQEITDKLTEEYKKATSFEVAFFYSCRLPFFL